MKTEKEWTLIQNCMPCTFGLIDMTRPYVAGESELPGYAFHALRQEKSPEKYMELLLDFYEGDPGDKETGTGGFVCGIYGHSGYSTEVNIFIGCWKAITSELLPTTPHLGTYL